MSIARSTSSRLSKYRARSRELQARLDNLIVETEAAAVKGQLDQWRDLRDAQGPVARELASVSASIAQLEFAQKINHPSRPQSAQVQR